MWREKKCLVYFAIRKWNNEFYENALTYFYPIWRPVGWFFTCVRCQCCRRSQLHSAYAKSCCGLRSRNRTQGSAFLWFDRQVLRANQEWGTVQVLLAADEETPARLEKEGLTLAGTRFTYAVGRLVLWSKQPGLVDEKGEVLRKGAFERLAIADPKLAPYGAAAVETLTQLGLLQGLQGRLVQGENIAQTYQFVATGNAALGFVALSQVMSDGRLTDGSAWVVPGNLHTAIRQDATMLSSGKDNPAAAALVAYLKGDKARAIIRSFGYEL